MLNEYIFEYKHNEINLTEIIKNYEIGELKIPLIIYIKNDNEYLKIRSRKQFNYYINYNNIEEETFFNICINVLKNKKSELRDISEDIKKYVENEIKNIQESIIIDPVYIECPKDSNMITFYCDFIYDNNTKKHPIFEIKEYLTKTLWNKDKFNFSRAEKGFNDLSSFKNKLIRANKHNQQLKLYPDFQPILKIYDKFNKNKNVYERHIMLKYNIKQIYFVDIDINPKPVF